MCGADRISDTIRHGIAGSSLDNELGSIREKDRYLIEELTVLLRGTRVKQGITSVRAAGPRSTAENLANTAWPSCPKRPGDVALPESDADTFNITTSFLT
jgi:hypothetical protein